MENLGCNPQAKKTLMSTMDKLAFTSDKFEELERLSNTLVAKFERTEGTVKNSDNELKNDRGTPSDIIDLFNNINDRLNLSLNKISDNIEKVVGMIE
jgi:hypothetical protein